MRGLVREVLGIASWAGSAYFAAWAFPFVKDRFRGWIGRADIADPLTVAVLFVVAVIILSMVAGMIGNLVRMSLIGGIDRTLGMVFGLVRGTAIVAFAYVAVGLAVPVENWPEVVQDARALPYIYRVAVATTDLLPEAYRPNIRPPFVEGRGPKVDDLLRANPQGRAIAHPAAPAPGDTK